MNEEKSSYLKMLELPLQMLRNVANVMCIEHDFMVMYPMGF